MQPRHVIAAFKHMVDGKTAPLIYLGSQFFSKNPSPQMAELESRLRAAYPETEDMALETDPNPQLLPDSAMRIRFHSVGGYGTIATGKLLTDILAGVLGMHSKSAPEVRLGEVRRADELLHHPQPRAGAHHERRARGRRGRPLAGPQGVRAHQPAQGPGRRAGRSSSSPT